MAPTVTLIVCMYAFPGSHIVSQTRGVIHCFLFILHNCGQITMELEDTVMFCNGDLPRDSFAALNDMRKSGELCDVTINVQNYSFTAHRVILAAGIPYFRAMFTSSKQDTKQREMDIVNLDPTTLESLIEYSYTSRINISKANAQSLLLASKTLQIYQVECACLECLSTRLNVANVVKIGTLAFTLNNLKLTETCNTYIVNNFEEFSKSDDFLSLSQECVKEIISKDDLNVTGEEIVYEAVIRWIKSSPAERLNVLHELLTEIRMVYLPVNYLAKKVATEDLISSSVDCMKIVQNVQSYHLLSKEEPACLNVNAKPRTNSSYTRNSSYTTNKMYALCFNNTDGYSVYSLTQNDTWHKLNSKQNARKTVVGVASANGNIYVFFLESISRFDPETLEWKEVKDESRNFDGASVLAHGNVIYCFSSRCKPLQRKVRRFDTKQNKWLTKREMMNPRHYSAGVTLGDFIYLTGGWILGERSHIAEKYNPCTDHWDQIASMISPRSNHSCAVTNKKIYVCGGYISAFATATCEVCDIPANQWKRIASFSTAKSHFSLVSFNEKLHAFVGTEGKINENETYELVDDRWKSTFPVPEGFVRAVMMPV